MFFSIYIIYLICDSFEIYSYFLILQVKAWDGKKHSRKTIAEHINKNNNLTVNTNDQSRPNTVMLEGIDVGVKPEGIGSNNGMLEKVAKIEFYLKEWRQEKEIKAKEREVVDHWREISVIWDKFFFWLFLGVLLFVTPVVFVIVPLFKPHPDLSIINHKE